MKSANMQTNEICKDMAQRLGQNLVDLLIQMGELKKCVVSQSSIKDSNSRYIEVGTHLAISPDQVNAIYTNQIIYLRECFFNTKNYMASMSSENNMEFLVDLEEEMKDIKLVYNRLELLVSDSVSYTSKTEIIKRGIKDLETMVNQSIEQIIEKSSLHYEFNQCFKKHAA